LGDSLAEAFETSPGSGSSRSGRSVGAQTSFVGDSLVKPAGRASARTHVAFPGDTSSAHSSCAPVARQWVRARGGFERS